MTYAEYWKLDSGFESEFTLTVDSSYFAPDDNFGGQTVLHFLGHKPDGDSRSIIMSMGADWSTTDGGYTVTHPTGKKTINQTSNYGHFITAALALDGFEAYLNEAGPPTDARIWQDITFDLKESEIARGGINRRTGETFAPSRVLLPVAYELPSPEPAPAPVAVVPPPVSEAHPASLSAADQLRARAAAVATPPSTLRDELVLLARNSPTHDAFVEAAANLPAVLEDESLLTEIVDSSPTGLWATARQ